MTKSPENKALFPLLPNALTLSKKFFQFSAADRKLSLAGCSKRERQMRKLLASLSNSHGSYVCLMVGILLPIACLIAFLAYYRYRYQPCVFFETNSQDLGTILGGKKTSYKLRFRNTGYGNIRVKRLYTGCSCIQAYSRGDPIPPGEDAVIDIILSVPIVSETQHLRQTVFAEFESMRGLTSTEKLDILAEVHPPFSISPAKLRFSRNGLSQSIAITLKRDMLEPATFLGIHLRPPDGIVLAKAVQDMNVITYILNVDPKKIPAQLSPLRLFFSTDVGASVEKKSP